MFEGAVTYDEASINPRKRAAVRRFRRRDRNCWGFLAKCVENSSILWATNAILEGYPNRSVADAFQGILLVYWTQKILENLTLHDFYVPASPVLL